MNFFVVAKVSCLMQAGFTPDMVTCQPIGSSLRML